MRIVIIGGGTGLSVLLRGLKQITSELDAVVNVVDDGGSSGILRRDLGSLPPGDIRSCLIALSNVSPLLEALMNYRFEKGVLAEQSFGNLMITALEDITGSFERAVKTTGDIIRITGRVHPVSLDHIDLKGTLENGKVIIGESALPKESLKEESPIRSVDIYPKRPRTTLDVIDAILKADFVLVGPGSLYTSILPALLVSGIKESILRSKARTIYIANLMTQPGETTGMSISDHVRVIYDHLEDPIFDEIFVNESFGPESSFEHYLEENQYPLRLTEEDRAYFHQEGIALTTGSYLEMKEGFIRHDAQAIAEDLKKLKAQLDEEKLIKSWPFK
ncbi:gluconeogenesis factor YvcK family protein [Guggenheimella bovis]